jgi:hypothetical protein
VEIDLLGLPSPSGYIADQLVTYAKTVIPFDHDRLTNEIYSTSNGWDHHESPGCEELLNDIYELLFTGPCYKIERWAALSIRFPDEESRINVDEICNSIEGVASNLKELRIENLSYALPPGLEDLPALESLTIIKNCAIPLRSFNFSSDNLKHLQISIYAGSENLRDLLLSPHLLTLELALDGPSSYAFNLVFGSPISYQSPSFKLRLPILQKLVVRGQYATLKNIDFDLPSLKILEIQTNEQLDVLPNVAPLRIDWTVDPTHTHRWKPRPIINAIATLMKFSKSTQVIVLPKLAGPYAGNAAHHLMVTGELAMLPCLRRLVVDQGNGKYSIWDLKDRALLEKMTMRMNEAKYITDESGDLG